MKEDLGNMRKSKVSQGNSMQIKDIQGNSRLFNVIISNQM